MDHSPPRPSARLRRLVNGYRVSQAIHVAATLGLSDLLGDGPCTVAQLADATDCDPHGLTRLLRALATVGLYEECPDGRFASTELGDALRSTAAEPVDGYAKYIGSSHHWQAWTGLLHGIRTGENAYQFIHGKTVWEDRADDPYESEVFDAAMTANSRAFAAAVLAAYDFGRFATVVDVGGGRGGMLAAILAAHPGQRGILVDQRHVIDGAPELLAAAGVADRCELVVADFFAEIPAAAERPADPATHPDPRGGDDAAEPLAGETAYVLKAILHDWDDARSLELLHTCRRAMGEGGTLVIIERLLEDWNVEAAVADLDMMVGPGGLERTTAEYRDLLAAAGLRLTRTVRTTSEVAILEATTTGFSDWTSWT
jgi:hypothetical protein